MATGAHPPAVASTASALPVVADQGAALHHIFAIGSAAAHAARVRKCLVDVRASSDGHARGPDLLKMAERVRRDPKNNAAVFWDALKYLILQGFESTEAAFRTYASPGDGGRMALPQFQELCEELGLQTLLGTAPLRCLFEVRPRTIGSWALQDFQDALMVKFGERIRGRMQEYTRGVARTAAHVDRLIRHLAIGSSEANRQRSVARFYRKLDLQFCVALWTQLQKWVVARLSVCTGDPSDINCATFLQFVERVVILQEYELEFFGNIFDRIDRRSQGRVKVADLVVALILLGSEMSHYVQARFIFCVFDSDSDGCLTGEQILRMYCSIAIHSVIARADRETYEADITLGDELSLAKARRLYEFTQTILSPSSADELYSFQEWWAVLEANPFMGEDLFPGTHSIEWALRSSKAQRPAAPGLAGPGAAGPGAAAKEPARRALVRRRNSGENGGGGTLPRRPGNRTMLLSLPERVENSPAPQPLKHAERFRVQAAIRFRHAVRGEWDAVEALRQELQSSTVSRPFSRSLAQLKEEEDPWVGAVNAYHRMERQGTWADRHSSTLANWAKPLPPPGLSIEDDRGRRSRPADRTGKPRVAAPRTLGQSRSLPSLAPSARMSSLASGPPATPLSMAPSQEQLQDRLAEVAAQARASLPVVPLEPFGRSALSRIRAF